MAPTFDGPALPSDPPPAHPETADPQPAQVARSRPADTGSFGPALPAVLGMALGGFAIGTTEFATMGLLPQIASGTGVSIPTAGHYISAYALGVVVGAPVLAVLAAKWPRKGTLLALMGLFAVSHLATPFMSSYLPLLVNRFISGLPHGAYFGIASLVAASLVPPERRTHAVALLLGGISVANVVGVPMATVLGQWVGWQWAYVVVGALGAATVATVAAFVPRQPVEQGASMAREFRSLRSAQVWFALAIGTVGFGGMFSTYSYIAPTMTTLAGFGDSAVPWIVCLYGLGSTAGMMLAGRVGRLGLARAIRWLMAAIAIWLFAFGFLAQSKAIALPAVFILGLLPSILVPLLQSRLMQVAREGQGLAAALNHSTLNIANALGAWLGGVVLAMGLGYAWPSRVGALLALLGLAIALVAGAVERRGESLPA